jgi:hypothetical protein
MAPRIYRTVTEINKNARPDEYLVNIRKGLDKNGNPKPYRAGPYSNGYYYHFTSPIRQDPMGVLKRAVEEFITSKSSNYSNAICIEYARKGVKVRGSYDNEVSYKMYISKRSINLEDKIVKNEVTPAVQSSFNPFEGLGDFISRFQSTDTLRVNACEFPRICPICGVDLDVGDYQLSLPFKCQHGYHTGHDELQWIGHPDYLKRCLVCSANKRRDTNFQYYFNLESSRGPLINSTLGNARMAETDREALPKKLTTVPKNLQDIVVNDLDKLLEKTLDKVSIREITMGEVYSIDNGATFNKYTVLYRCRGPQCWGNASRRARLVKEAYFKSPLREQVAKQLGNPYNPDFYRSFLTEIGEDLGKTPEEIKKDIRDYERENSQNIIQSQIQRFKPPSKRDQGYGKIRN